MKKKVAMLLGLLMAASAVMGCSTEELYAEVSTEVEAYNAAVAAYNDQVAIQRGCRFHKRREQGSNSGTRQCSDGY